MRTKTEVLELASSAGRTTRGGPAEFVQLYNGLFSDATDAQYEAQAKAFADANCS